MQILRKKIKYHRESVDITFQSGLPIFFSKVGPSFELMSSRGRPSDPLAEAADIASAALIVLLIATAGPCNIVIMHEFHIN
jgi:hypothetical protein